MGTMMVLLMIIALPFYAIRWLIDFVKDKFEDRVNAVAESRFNEKIRNNGLYVRKLEVMVDTFRKAAFMFSGNKTPETAFMVMCSVYKTLEEESRNLLTLSDPERIYVSDQLREYKRVLHDLQERGYKG